MADVRLLIQEEGRTARNLIAFNVPVGTSNNEKITKKPPSAPRIVPSNSKDKRSMKSTARIRSASTGRDKKSELQARYWAFLFGNLQRAVDGIYQTCEEDENISECKEVILVLENYTRDFHNLIEWFKVKWAYENSSPPLRRTPLAWEVRKTSPCRLWNSSVNAKPTSPSHRTSPTDLFCRSPVEHSSCQNKTSITDNKLSSTREKTCTKTTNKIALKQPLSAKQNVNNLTDSKISIDSKLKMNIKNNCNQARNVQQVQMVKKSVSQLAIEKIHNKSADTENRTPRVSKVNNKIGSCENFQINTLMETKQMETIKNEINTQVSKDSKKENNGKLITVQGSESSKLTKITDTLDRKQNSLSLMNKNVQNDRGKTSNTCTKTKKVLKIIANDNVDNKIRIKSSLNSMSTNGSNRTPIAQNTSRSSYSVVSQSRKQTTNIPDVSKLVRSKTTLCDRRTIPPNRARPGTSVIVRRPFQPLENESSNSTLSKKDQQKSMNGSVEVLTKQVMTVNNKEENDGWHTVRSRYRRGSSHNLNMSTRFHKPSSAMSLPTLSMVCSVEKSKKNSLTPDTSQKQKKRFSEERIAKNISTEIKNTNVNLNDDLEENENILNSISNVTTMNETNSTAVIAAIFKNDAELLEKRIQQFMAAQAERERIILEEERKTEEADSQRSQQLSDEEASLKRQILELESTEIDIDTETDETDGEMALETDDSSIKELEDVNDDISLEDRYENMLEGMSWAERVDTLAQLRALVARHPGRALELHQKLSSPSRKRSLPETLRRYQAKQACAQHKRQKLLMEKSQRLRDLLNKVEDVKSAKNQLIEDKRFRMEMKLKRAEENRTQHLLEIVRKAHDEDSKLKEIAFINELEAQNKRHDFMALCQEQEERLQGIQEERQRRQEEKAAKEAAAEERRKVLEAERQLRIQKMKQARREREERVGKMQLEREKERQELAREKARDREERLSALHAAQLANQEELQKKIAHKQQESARRHVENIEHIRQRAVESSILRSEEVLPTLKSYPSQKQCSLCNTMVQNEVCLLSHLKGKIHLEAVRNAHDGREPSRDELQRFNIAQIRDVSTTGNTVDNKAAKEKQKALKRRCRKIKQRLATRGQEWEESNKQDEQQRSVDSANKVKFRRNLKELDRLYSNHAKTAWSGAAISALERSLGEIGRSYGKVTVNDQDVFGLLNGFETFSNILDLGLNGQNGTYNLPNKSIILLCKVYKYSIQGNNTNRDIVFLSNKILVIVDILLQRLENLSSLDDNSQVQESSGNSSGNGVVATAVAQLLCSLIPPEPFENPSLQTRVQDITSYLVAGGLIERVARHARALVETDFFGDQERESSLLLACYDLLARLCRHSRRSSLGETTSASHSETNDQSSVEFHLINGLANSEAAGSIGAMYAMVAFAQNQSQNQKGSSPTPNHQQGLTGNVKSLAERVIALLRSMGEIDLVRLQNMLSAEGTCLQWRLIGSHLIGRLSRELVPSDGDLHLTSAPCVRLLRELIILIGYFAVNNPENQLTIQTAGAGASMLQQLCTLPFPYYADPRLSSYTLPTLLAATHHNPEAKAVISCELSYQLLEDYRNSPEGKQNPLLGILKDT